MHLDLAVPRESAGRRLDLAITAGGRIAADVAAVRYWTCADAAGNKIDLVAWPDLPLPADDAPRLGAEGAGPAYAPKNDQIRQSAPATAKITHEGCRQRV